jgi:hypothetical protein
VTASLVSWSHARRKLGARKNEGRRFRLSSYMQGVPNPDESFLSFCALIRVTTATAATDSATVSCGIKLAFVEFRVVKEV